MSSGWITGLLIIVIVVLTLTAGFIATTAVLHYVVYPARALKEAEAILSTGVSALEERKVQKQLRGAEQVQRGLQSEHWETLVEAELKKPVADLKQAEVPNANLERPVKDPKTKVYKKRLVKKPPDVPRHMEAFYTANLKFFNSSHKDMALSLPPPAPAAPRDAMEAGLATARSLNPTPQRSLEAKRSKTSPSEQFTCGAHLSQREVFFELEGHKLFRQRPFSANARSSVTTHDLPKRPASAVVVKNRGERLQTQGGLSGEPGSSVLGVPKIQSKHLPPLPRSRWPAPPLPLTPPPLLDGPVEALPPAPPTHGEHGEHLSVSFPQRLPTSDVHPLGIPR